MAYFIPIMLLMSWVTAKMQVEPEGEEKSCFINKLKKWQDLMYNNLLKPLGHKTKL